jgi:hypothetical protein
VPDGEVAACSSLSKLTLAVLGDGRLASAREDGSIKLWPKGRAGEPIVLIHGSPILTLAVLGDGRTAP